MTITAPDAGSRQWLRSVRLLVGGNGRDEGLDLSRLRIVFKTKQGDNETPNKANILVYNLSEPTMQKVRDEFTRVILEAGYENNRGVIFDGKIIQARVYRDASRNVDRVLDILAVDGDQINFAVVNATLAAGSVPADHVGVCRKSLEQKGVGAGSITGLSGAPLPRGKVMYGMARKYLRDAAKTTGTGWSVQNGKLQVVPDAGWLPGEAVVLTAATGLVGAPEQMQDGVKLRCLLNPRLKVGGRVKLDNKSIKEAETPVKKASGDTPPKLDADGFYRILSIDWSGDTHGKDWYADIICIGIDETAKKTKDKK